jgi:hypothetical protein
MLQTNTVYPRTLAILRQVMQMPEFQAFNLVSGTSLALQIGHRISIDLDLFTHQDYDDTPILEALQTIGDLEILINKPPFLQLRLDEVKMDFLKFPYAFVQEYVEIEGVRLVSIENIAVMKLLAISRRGVKKDFYDLYFILERYTMTEIVVLFKEKLPNVDMFHILKSLSYFGDADPDPDPKMFIKVSWATVKKTIISKTQTYLKTII